MTWHQQASNWLAVVVQWLVLAANAAGRGSKQGEKINRNGNYNQLALMSMQATASSSESSVSLLGLYQNLQ